MIPSGYKTISWVAGIAVAMVASPEFQAFIEQYPDIAFWINCVVMVVLRWFTTKPLPAKDKLEEKFNPPWKQKKGK